MPWLWPLTAIQPAFGQQVGDGHRGGERQAGGADDQERQDRAAVDDQQDQQDDAERGEQQQAVDAGEAVGEVGERGAGAGDVLRRPVDAVDGRAGRRRARAARRRGPGSIGRTAWTAAPSSDGIGGEASPARAPASSAIVVACVDAVADLGQLLLVERRRRPPTAGSPAARGWSGSRAAAR